LALRPFFTLVLIPVIYSLLVPLAPSRVHAGIRLYRELCEAELATEMSPGVSPGAASAAE
jgi:hypothetical protein